MIRRARRVLRPSLECLERRSLLSGTTLSSTISPTQITTALFPSSPTGLSPAQVASAYGLGAITFNANGTTVTGNGAGQTIAIIDAFHDPYLSSDLHTFDQTYGLPDPALTQVDQAGASTNDGWAGEETLDVEWAHAIAPAAHIVVVEAASDSLSDLLNAVNTARSMPGVSAISMSWGGSEFSSQTSYDSTFTTPAGHQGITFIASSGDSGPSAGAEWPASSPNVLGVGGTTLSLVGNGSYGSETAWSGSGGGTSQVEPEPSYQGAVQSSGSRVSPDVAFDADPNSGVAVYTTTPSNGQGGWVQVGGTSLGAPSWAGIMAIVNQGLATQGKGSLDGASQTLPALYGLPSSDFHAVNSLFSFFGPSVNTTGLGTPNGPTLVRDLVYGVGQPSAASPTGGSGGTLVSGGSSDALVQASVLVSSASASGESDSAFVTSLFQAALGRSPDAEGYNYFLGQLQQGVSRTHVAEAMFLTPEAQTVQVAHWYQDDFGDTRTLAQLEADPGVQFWAGISNTYGPEAAHAGLLSSNEFYQSQGGTDAEFVTGLFQALLGRAPDASGFNYYLGQLQQGVSRYDVARALENTAEARATTVAHWYQDEYAWTQDLGSLKVNAIVENWAGFLSDT